MSNQIMKTRNQRNFQTPNINLKSKSSNKLVSKQFRLHHFPNFEDLQRKSRITQASNNNSLLTPKVHFVNSSQNEYDDSQVDYKSVLKRDVLNLKRNY